MGPLIKSCERSIVNGEWSTEAVFHAFTALSQQTSGSRCVPDSVAGAREMGLLVLRSPEPVPRRNRPTCRPWTTTPGVDTQGCWARSRKTGKKSMKCQLTSAARPVRHRTLRVSAPRSCERCAAGPRISSVWGSRQTSSQRDHRRPVNTRSHNSHQPLPHCSNRSNHNQVPSAPADSPPRPATHG